MKTLLLFFSLLFLTTVNAADNDDLLKIEKEGLIVSVVDFKEGDKIKLFEVETGDHILSKTRGQIDLSELPKGKYLLENNEGKSVVIERTGEEIVFEKELSDDYLVNDSERMNGENKDMEEQLESFYVNSEAKILDIDRDGDVITVLDFEEGDMIKLFEVKNTVHVLSKKVRYIDLSQLPAGVYFIENNNGDSVIVEKFLDKDQVAADM